MSKKDKTKGKSKAKATEAEVPTNAPDRHLLHVARVAEAARVVADPDSSKKEKKAARSFLDEARQATNDRVLASNSKTAADLSGARMPDALPGESEAEYQMRNLHDRKASDAELKAKVKAKREARESDPVADPDAERSAAWRNEYDRLRAIIKDPATKKKALKAANLDLDALRAPTADDVATAEAIDEGVMLDTPDPTPEPVQIAEEILTEDGREFAVGAPAEVEAAVEPVERDRFGRPYVEFTKADGTTGRKAYTRVTTYIKGLDDTTNLEKWKMRTLLEGAGIDLDGYGTDEGRDLADSLVARARKISVAYDKALAKVDKREAKGELDLGQFAQLRAEAKKAHDDALNELAETALDLGGAHDKATKGTDLHALCERYDKGQLDIPSELAAGTLTKVDAADVQAYAAKMAELGIEFFDVERLVVIDELGVAGTLDRAGYYKFPGTARRVRCVMDIKTGRVDYSAGTIGMQLRAYSLGKGYDPAQPLERIDLKLSKSKGLLIHLPAGEARCEVYVVDLDLAAEGLRLAREVRDWRNTGKRVYNLKMPVSAIVAEGAAS